MTSKVWDKQHGGSHYQKYKIQPSKFVVENELLYPEGCAIKYIIRHRDKNGKEDILKAIHFLHKMALEYDPSSVGSIHLAQLQVKHQCSRNISDRSGTPFVIPTYLVVISSPFLIET